MRIFLACQHLKDNISDGTIFRAFKIRSITIEDTTCDTYISCKECLTEEQVNSIEEKWYKTKLDMSTTQILTGEEVERLLSRVN